MNGFCSHDFYRELIANSNSGWQGPHIKSDPTFSEPRSPLFEWVLALGYVSGSVVKRPVLYGAIDTISEIMSNIPPNRIKALSQLFSTEPSSYTAFTIAQSPAEGMDHSAESVQRSPRTLIPQLNALVDHFKTAFDGFCVVWFVVCNVWVFGGHSSLSEAPNLYRLSLVLLTFGCIGYAIPFAICATICCSMSCIISILGFWDDRLEITGATLESINALPSFKFMVQKNKPFRNHEISTIQCEGGILAAGTKRGRVLLGEDAVCCICLTKYAENDELRELPCFHVFHIECIDKWLKTNALCPLCRKNIGQSRST